MILYGKRVVVEDLPEQHKTEQGIILTNESDLSAPRLIKGVVRFVGEDTTPQKFKVGQEVLYAKTTGSLFLLNGKQYRSIMEEGVLFG